MDKSGSDSDSERSSMVPDSTVNELQLQVRPCENGLEVPVMGTIFRVVSNSSKGNKRLPIVVAPEKNKFFALFDEDDVDFMFEVDNEPAKDRDVNFQLRVHNSDDSKGSFIIRKGETGAVTTLKSGGRKLHFIKQSGEEGQVCVGTFASNLGLKYEDASRLISQIGISVKYSNPGFDLIFMDYTKTDTEAVHKVHAEPTEVIYSLQTKLGHLTGIHPSDVRLLHGGWRLGDVMTVADYNLGPGDELEVYRAQFGGGGGGPGGDDSSPDVPKKLEAVGERGAIVFGDKSNQKFSRGYPRSFDKSVMVEDFVIELRMASRFHV